MGGGGGRKDAQPCSSSLRFQGVCTLSASVLGSHGWRLSGCGVRSSNSSGSPLVWALLLTLGGPRVSYWKLSRWLAATWRPRPPADGAAGLTPGPLLLCLPPSPPSASPPLLLRPPPCLCCSWLCSGPGSCCCCLSWAPSDTASLCCCCCWGDTPLRGCCCCCLLCGPWCGRGDCWGCCSLLNSKTEIEGSGCTL